MSKYLDGVRMAADSLERAEAAYAIAKDRLARVRDHNGQGGYSVTVNGVTVAVSQCDSRTYQGTLIRGREMIHLGALKALGSELDACLDRVKKARTDLLAAVN